MLRLAIGLNVIGPIVNIRTGNAQSVRPGVKTISHAATIRRMTTTADVHVHLVPTLFEPGDLTGGVAVMIDVLRASTTICHALAAGAEAVVPLSEVPRTLALANSDASGLAAGERAGKPPEGFDLGNSPSDFTADQVAGKVVYFTTTNGTQALQRMRQADEVLIAAFVNRAAIAERLRTESRPLHFVCAGTDGAKTAEDVLLAGALVKDLLSDVPLGSPLGTQLAYDHYVARCEEGRVIDAVRAGLGGQNLARIGLDQDIDAAMAESTIDLIPSWDLRTNRLTASGATMPPAPPTPPTASPEQTPTKPRSEEGVDDGLGGW